MVDREHAGHHGGQDLCGTNVGSGLFAANVLLTGLQRQAIGRLTLAVHTHAHQAAGHGALVGIAASKISRMRAAAAHGHAKALGGAHHDVGIPFARRCQQGQGQQVGGHTQGGLFLMDLRRKVAPILHLAMAGRVLHQHAKAVALAQQLPRITDLHLNVQRFCAGLNDLDGLRKTARIDHKNGAGALGAALGQGHGFGRRGGLIQHRGIGNRHAGELTHHGLEIHQRFHAALADFGLVRGVGRVPSRIFQNVAQDDARRVGAVVALADEAFEQLIL